MLRQIRSAVVMTIALCLVTGVLYPVIVTGAAQLLFPHQAQGSLITRNGQVIGSALIGQRFASTGYFHGRPSAAGTNGYDAMASSGSNKGPTDSTLTARISERVTSARALRDSAPVPADLVTASGSGLDPDLSPASAAWQVSRVAAARGLPNNLVAALVARHTSPRQFGVLGEPRVNVLRLNLALDSLVASSPSVPASH